MKGGFRNTKKNRKNGAKLDMLLEVCISKEGSEG